MILARELVTVTRLFPPPLFPGMILAELVTVTRLLPSWCGGYLTQHFNTVGA